eukprot:TRINITY_DN64413_c0_g1_i1.p1 TRINITY_DN64413_c0_g1~~TRINITY_DN64413_c0_g1_i1.p1  ORF type:complete len:222 (-),score=11.97 TRINITY_DN64413_c0_g1_i1:36-632(-)
MVDATRFRNHCAIKRGHKNFLTIIPMDQPVYIAEFPHHGVFSSDYQSAPFVVSSQTHGEFSIMIPPPGLQRVQVDRDAHQKGNAANAEFSNGGGPNAAGKREPEPQDTVVIPTLAYRAKPRVNVANAFNAGAVARSENALGDKGVISVGSVGHPVCCGLGCKYFWKPRGCKDGANCLRCHICKYKRRKLPKTAGESDS